MPPCLPPSEFDHMEPSVQVQNNFCVLPCSKWLQYSFPIRPTFNEKNHTHGIVSTMIPQHTQTHTNKIMQLTSLVPQIILSNSSLTPAVSEHFPRVHSHNPTTEGDQSTRKTKLTHQKILLLPPSLPCSLLKTPKVLCHLLVILENALFFSLLCSTAGIDWFVILFCSIVVLTLVKWQN